MKKTIGPAFAAAVVAALVVAGFGAFAEIVEVKISEAGGLKTVHLPRYPCVSRQCLPAHQAGVREHLGTVFLRTGAAVELRLSCSHCSRSHIMSFSPHFSTSFPFSIR
jgi:hypothetical protein